MRARKATVRPARVVDYLIFGDVVVVISIWYLGAVQIFITRFN